MEEHAAIVEAIRVRDPAAARHAAQTHLINAARRLAEAGICSGLDMTRNVGVIGLGAMGMGVARSLLRAGFAVHACDVR